MVPQGAKTHGCKLAGFKHQHALSRSSGGERSVVTLSQGPVPSRSGGEDSPLPGPLPVGTGSPRCSLASLRSLGRMALSPSRVPVRLVSSRKDTGCLSSGSYDQAPQVVAYTQQKLVSHVLEAGRQRGRVPASAHPQVAGASSSCGGKATWLSGLSLRGR